MLKKPHRVRVVLLAAVFLLLGGAVLARLAILQLDRHDHFLARAKGQQTKRVVMQPERGEILDRTGRPLAQSTGRMAVYVDPRYFDEPGIRIDAVQLARHTAHYSDTPEFVIRRRLERKTPVALARGMHPNDARRVVELLESYGLDERAFWLHRESRRLYPRSLAASVIGFCSSDGDGDNLGISGIEFHWNKTLTGKRIETSSRRSAISQTLQPVSQADIRRSQGNTLVLTLDAMIQEAAEEALKEAVTKFEAAGAGAIAMDVRTGAILAMADYPTFDNNDFRSAGSTARRNRNLTDPLETGSVAKLFTSAMLIDLGVLSPDTMIDCEGGRWVIDGRRITDAPGHDPLHLVPFRVALAYSSNVGIIKAAQAMDNQTWMDYLKKFNIGSRTGIDLPGEGVGILHPLERWTRLSRSSLPMGYEMALTPIQIVAGIGAMVNDGNYMRPYIVQEVRDPHGRIIERFEPQVVRQVIRPTTSAIMRELMAEVVTEGTGKKANIDGYRVGGKTGTTVKSQIRDRKEYISTFVGVVPIDHPGVAIYVYVDAPTKARYGGTVAAPAFNKIARAAMLHLGIPPSEPVVDTEAQMAAAVFGAEGFEDYAEYTAEASAVTVTPAAPPATGGAAPVVGPAMPDLRGLTMAEVRSRLPETGARVRFAGTGLVADQSPLPGEPVGEQSEIFVHFTTEAERALTPEQLAALEAIAAAAKDRKSPRGTTQSSSNHPVPVPQPQRPIPNQGVPVP